MEWTNSLIIEFLALYEKYPVIWNPKHQSHKNRNVVSDAWNDIRSELSVQMTVTELKKKKESLMATYRTLKKKMYKKPTGSGSNDVYKPSWFAFKIMHEFLRSIGEVNVTLRSEEDDIEDRGREDISNDKEGSDKEQAELELQESTAIGNDEDITAYERIVTSEIPRKRCNSPKQVSNKKKRGIFDTSEIEKCVKNASSLLQTVMSRPTPSSEDKFDLYGKLLASKLREMEAKKCAMVMNQIDNLVFNAQMEDCYVAHSSQHFSQPVQFQHNYSAENMNDSSISSQYIQSRTPQSIIQSSPPSTVSTASTSTLLQPAPLLTEIPHSSDERHENTDLRSFYENSSDFNNDSI